MHRLRTVTTKPGASFQLAFREREGEKRIEHGGRKGKEAAGRRSKARPDSKAEDAKREEGGAEGKCLCEIVADRKLSAKERKEQERLRAGKTAAVRKGRG